MSEEKNIPQEEITKDNIESPQTSQEIVEEIIEEKQEQVPEMHPVHKSKMVLLIVVTIVLGLVSIVSLIFVLRMRNGEELFFKFAQKDTPKVEQKMEEEKVETEEKELVRKDGEFNPIDVVKELDNLGLENIESYYLDSGLN